MSRAVTTVTPDGNRARASLKSTVIKRLVVMAVSLHLTTELSSYFLADREGGRVASWRATPSSSAPARKNARTRPRTLRSQMRSWSADINPSCGIAVNDSPTYYPYRGPRSRSAGACEGTVLRC